MVVMPSGITSSPVISTPGSENTISVSFFIRRLPFMLKMLPSAQLMVVIAVQPWNAPPLNDTSDLGRLMVVSAVQLLNV